MPNAGDERKSSAVRDKVVWKEKVFLTILILLLGPFLISNEKVVLDYFDIATRTHSNLRPERSCT